MSDRTHDDLIASTLDYYRSIHRRVAIRRRHNIPIDRDDMDKEREVRARLIALISLTARVGKLEDVAKAARNVALCLNRIPGWECRSMEGDREHVLLTRDDLLYALAALDAEDAGVVAPGTDGALAGARDDHFSACPRRRRRPVAAGHSRRARRGL
jgi:hypothetical protein